jgi:hypothetical protein
MAPYTIKWGIMATGGIAQSEFQAPTILYIVLKPSG